MKMNIQKSRFAAMVTVMLMVCTMVTMLVVPASASEIADVTFYPSSDASATIGFRILNSMGGTVAQPAQLGSFGVTGNVTVYANESLTITLVSESDLRAWLEAYNNNLDPNLTFDFGQDHYTSSDGTKYYVVEYALASCDTEKPTTFTYHSASEGSSGISGSLFSTVTKDMLSGVLDEIKALLPVVIPVMIGFIGLRKGISFLQNVLHSA